VEVVRVGELHGRLDLELVLDELGRRKILSVLLECGSALNGAFLQAELVDKVVLIYSPAKLGRGSVPFAAGVDEAADLEGRLKRVREAEFGPDRSVSGILRDAWDGLG
jgi:diaminohydroxyphosphoribosylaminopyrimidine deaminase/5-amino-6-(5-phosphoribosylamino)uracil reductase